jgi:hypothetical protein
MRLSFEGSLKMRLAFYPLAFAVAFTALAGCRSVMDPTAMPAGYSYHQNIYKSPPGPPAADIGYPFSSERNDVVVEKWQAAAGRLVSKLESDLNIQPQAVYVESLPHANAFNTSLDYVLREELRSRGYTLANTPLHVLHLKPEIYLEGDEKIPVEPNAYNDDPEVRTEIPHREKAQDFRISITALRDNVLKGRIAHEFALPAYGYVRGEGQDRRESKLYRQAPEGSDAAVTQKPPVVLESAPADSESEQLAPLPPPAEIQQEPL